MNESPFSLKNKTVFITGASSGLGAGAAIECSKAGAKLVISGRSEERLGKVYGCLEGEGHERYIADLTSRSSIDDLADLLPPLDGLVLCAGITKTIPVKFISDEAVDEIFRTNTFSSMQLIKKLLKQKKLKRGGSIVFISSISTSYADKGNSIYAASKGAINSFSRVLALEMATKNITSNCIQPGFVPTSMLEKGSITEDQLEAEKKKYPLGFGDVTDIAYGVIYLLSDASKWITGSIFTIDGGVTLR
jgi:NAD(P)-dependent dehydrogenase (short-subunit alcohol dehydrogenase family)